MSVEIERTGPSRFQWEATTWQHGCAYRVLFTGLDVADDPLLRSESAGRRRREYALRELRALLSEERALLRAHRARRDR